MYILYKSNIFKSLLISTFMEVNWFVNSACNLPCGFCFRDMNVDEEDTKQMVQLVNYMADNGVTKVTIGGGEPLLRKNFRSIKIQKHFYKPSCKWHFIKKEN